MKYSIKKREYAFYSFKRTSVIYSRDNTAHYAVASSEGHVHQHTNGNFVRKMGRNSIAVRMVCRKRYIQKAHLAKPTACITVCHV